MSKLKLKKHLLALDKSHVIELIMEMYGSHKEAKEYFEFYLNPNEREQFEKYRRVIEKEFDFDKGRRRVSVAKKAIASFAKLKPSEPLIAELMIHFVLVGCKLTYDNGSYSESFYKAFVHNYERALKYMANNRLLEQFRGEAELCLKYASRCGYGFPNDMRAVFAEFYES